MPRRVLARWPSPVTETYPARRAVPVVLGIGERLGGGRTSRRGMRIVRRARHRTACKGGHDERCSDAPDHGLNRISPAEACRVAGVAGLVSARGNPLQSKSTIRLGMALVAALGVVPWGTAAAKPGDTVLVSRTPSGGFPNGPSANPALSQDRRGPRSSRSTRRRAISWPATPTASATCSSSVAEGRSRSTRGAPTPWKPGKTELVSTGMGGAPANGPSFHARPRRRPDPQLALRCVPVGRDRTSCPATPTRRPTRS